MKTNLLKLISTFNWLFGVKSKSNGDEGGDNLNLNKI